MLPLLYSKSQPNWRISSFMKTSYEHFCFLVHVWCPRSQCDIDRTARVATVSPISPNLHPEALPHAYAAGDDAVPGGGEGGGPRMSVRSCGVRRIPKRWQRMAILVHYSRPFRAQYGTIKSIILQTQSSHIITKNWWFFKHPQSW